MAFSTGGTPPALRDVDDVTELGPCDAEATIAGVDGPIVLSRCWRPKGHLEEHAGPFDRVTWGGGAQADV